MVSVRSPEYQSVALNAYRYNVPLNASNDIDFAGHAVFEFQGARLYTDAGILANEQLVMDTMNDDGGPAIARPPRRHLSHHERPCCRPPCAGA